MPWVLFIDDFDWHVPDRNGRVTIAYKRDMRQLVTAECAAAACAAGRAVRISVRPPKPKPAATAGGVS